MPAAEIVFTPARFLVTGTPALVAAWNATSWSTTSGTGVSVALALYLDPRDWATTHPAAPPLAGYIGTATLAVLFTLSNDAMAGDTNVYPDRGGGPVVDPGSGTADVHTVRYPNPVAVTAERIVFDYGAYLSPSDHHADVQAAILAALNGVPPDDPGSQLELAFESASATDPSATDAVSLSLASVEFVVVLAALVPSGGPLAGGTTVTVSWSAIADGATVTIDGASVAFNGTAHTFVTPTHGAGTAHVTITNPDATTITFPFIYFHPPILIPTTGPIAGGTLVTVQRVKADGEGEETAFVPGASIAFDGVAATSVTCVDANHSTCVTPAHATGFVTVDLVHLDARAITMTLENGFAYGTGAVKAPRVTVTPPQTVPPQPLPASVTIAATVTGDGLSLRLWTQIVGPAHALIVNPSSLSTEVRFPVYTPGVYTFRFTASDPAGTVPPISLTTTVTLPPPTPPHIVLT